jgi:hypothetical protein
VVSHAGDGAAGGGGRGVREEPEVIGLDRDPLFRQGIDDQFHRADPRLVLAVTDLAEIALIQTGLIVQRLQRPAQPCQVAVERRPVESLPVGHRCLASPRLIVIEWRWFWFRRAERGLVAAEAAPTGRQRSCRASRAETQRR